MDETEPSSVRLRVFVRNVVLGKLRRDEMECICLFLERFDRDHLEVNWRSNDGFGGKREERLVSKCLIESSLLSILFDLLCFRVTGPTCCM